MAGEYVFNLMRVTKQYNKVTVLDDVTLAFFFGAKIGVIGGNGSGKSSLLRILGGIDTEFMGEAQIAKNMQDRLPAAGAAARPDEGRRRQRRGRRRRGARDPRRATTRSASSWARSCPTAESEKLNDELGRLQDLIDTHDLWELDHQVELAMEALRLPPPRRAGRRSSPAARSAAWRCAAC